MGILRKVIVIAWLLVSLFSVIVGYTDRAIYAIAWAIFMQLNILENKIKD